MPKASTQSTSSATKSSIDPATVVAGATVALQLIRQLQLAVNRKHGALTLADVRMVVDKNLKAENAWDASKEKRLKELEAENKELVKKLEELPPDKANDKPEATSGDKQS